ncbi:ThiF family adenylyltransferase [Corynebacterium sp. TA-R-1]|uniref:ThiF family adenylyltransferase n=1 Tax=Corynebacterium stercoris TaxID=2943490 RepID=A0ABT1G1R1_9CORY|nr:ThiF family adenylyltransferase [Corynebacterium stercoris]MCP1387930.1 ThiF family adenylyltransferase [Corynebacterium stercoris]
MSASLPREELARTARQMNLPGFGLPEQEALHNAHVLVIGAGGLGCPVMQALAATGVGEITVVDDDVVSLSNIHRQILFGAVDVGRKKVEVAAERLRELQPGITVHAVDARLDESNIVAALKGIDVLIDGSDTFTTKFLAADAAEITGTPLVWGSVLRYRGDVALWWSGPGAPADGVGMRDLYPAQPDPDSVPDCATAGVLGVTTSVVGGLMATETVKFLTGVGEAKVGRLHMYDALTASVRHFNVARDPGRELVTELGVYAQACAVPIDDGGDAPGAALISMLERGAAVSLDVREPHEKALTDIAVPGPNLPMSELDAPGRVDEVLDVLPAGDVVVYCAGGVRSAKFVDRFRDTARERGLTLHSLPGGAQRWGAQLA